MRAACLSLLVLGGVSHRAMAQAAVAPLPGYECRVLDITDAQAHDPAFGMPVLTRPAIDAPVLGNASGIVLVHTPAVPVNGYLQVLFPNRRTGWIAPSALRPYRSRGNPGARCTPVLLSNGIAGFDVR